MANKLASVDTPIKTEEFGAEFLDYDHVSLNSDERYEDSFKATTLLSSASSQPRIKEENEENWKFNLDDDFNIPSTSPEEEILSSSNRLKECEIKDEPLINPHLNLFKTTPLSSSSPQLRIKEESEENCKFNEDFNIPSTSINPPKIIPPSNHLVECTIKEKSLINPHLRSFKTTLLSSASPQLRIKEECEENFKFNEDEDFNIPSASITPKEEIMPSINHFEECTIKDEPLINHVNYKSNLIPFVRLVRLDYDKYVSKKSSLSLDKCKISSSQCDVNKNEIDNGTNIKYRLRKKLKPKFRYSDFIEYGSSDSDEDFTCDLNSDDSEVKQSFHATNKYKSLPSKNINFNKSSSNVLNKFENTNISKNLTCYICNKTLTTKHGLENHIRTHIGLKPFICQYCPYTASQQSIIYDHERTHTKERPYKCKYCPYRACQRSTLTTHMNTHLSIFQRKMFSCDYCLVHYTRRSTLNDHLIIKHNRRIESEFSSKKHLSRGHKVFSCNKCYFSSKSLSLLKKHKKNMNHESDSSLMSQSTVSEMFEGDQPSDNKYFCDHCSYSTKLKSAIRKHCSVHQDIRPYKCTLCPYAAKLRRTLEDHISTHVDSRRFKCDHCSFDSTKKQLLRNHILENH